ncbi:xanthine dehydrogenase small subunit [Tepidimonas taiwanensis]|uniref:xanthine dehydrogenase small subunit n=1 Tax=Tepidimonas taiwanensis TaxID=307486 RepID=UPI000734A8EA|nr:xanthine dehydrogenase small subunit [Tepidimonas taiwanensis]
MHDTLHAPPPSAPPPLPLVHRGQVEVLHSIAPDRTLLSVLREELGLTAVKEGCASGDCGACTVAVADVTVDGALRWRALNSCLRLAHSVAGCAVWTSADLVHDPLIARATDLHPVQEAMRTCHASQCGFCTPGFVMSLFVAYQRRAGEGLGREEAVRVLSGNLCRCTGYRPILDAARAMGDYPRAAVDEARLRALVAQADAVSEGGPEASTYLAPRTLTDALAARARWPQAVVVAGSTDAALALTKRQARWERVLDVSRCAALTAVGVGSDDTGPYLRIGAAVTLEQAWAVLCERWPRLGPFAERFAGEPIRHGGTLGGNVVNGSPIGDSMPVLIALGARLVLQRLDAQAGIQTRALPIEDFYLGYRRTALRGDELLTAVDVPLSEPLPQLAAYKLAKRHEDDISTVSLAVAWRLDPAGTVQHVRIGVGGVAATPVRATAAEAQLLHRPWRRDALQRAATVLQASVQPLDDGRASAAYRRAMLGALLMRLAQTTVPGTPASPPVGGLESLAPIVVEAEPQGEPS